MTDLMSLREKAQVVSRVTITRIELEKICFSYEADRPLLKDVSLRFETGGVSWLNGEAGSGQSTLLKILAMLVQPQSGSYWIDDIDLLQLSFEEFLPLRCRMSYSFDFGGLLANRTVRENLLLPISYHQLMDMNEAQELINDWAKRFRFFHQLDERPAHVSGGLRKLVCVLRAILVRPQILLMDDPFTGLDPKTRTEFLALLTEERKRGASTSVLFTSNDEDWARRLCTNEVWVGTRRSGVAV